MFSGRMRRKTTIQTAANTHIPTSTAPAAPAAPHTRPNTTTSGSMIAVFLRIRPENVHRPEPADEVGEAGALAR